MGARVTSQLELVPEPHCYHCGSKTNLYTVSDKRGNRQTRYLCRPCNTERVKKYRQGTHGKATMMRNTNKYRKAHPERPAAWYRARRAYPTMEKCEICGNPKTDRHHPDIAKPLEIVWLCRLHHKQAHKLMLQ